METNVTQLAKEFARLKEEHEKAGEAVKRLADEWNTVETQLLEAMVEEGVNSVSVVGCGLFSLTTKNYLSVKAENKSGFFDYLRQTGNEGLLKLDVNPRTLSAFLKEHLEELVAKAVSTGQDAIDARNHSLEALKNVGASYFSDRTIRFKGE